MPMPQKEEYLRDLLDALQTMLHVESRGAEAALVATLRRKLLLADDPVRALEEFYAVKGCDRFALRLLWYVEESPSVPTTPQNDAVTAFRVWQLSGDLARSFPESPPSAEGQTRAGQTGDWEEALRRFGIALDALRRDAFDEGRFVGLRRSFFDAIEHETDTLYEVAGAQKNEEVVRFAAAFKQFIQYLCQENLLSDVRVLNFLESANLTLQTAVHTLGPDDFDSLHQTTELLKNPATLFDVPPSRETTR
jgi:hypothetical protein